MEHKQFKGFGFQLSPTESIILSVFRDNPEVCFPVDCGLTEEETLETLLNLTKKNIIKGKAPYTLTKLGRRLLEETDEDSSSS